MTTLFITACLVALLSLVPTRAIVAAACLLALLRIMHVDVTISPEPAAVEQAAPQPDASDQDDAETDGETEQQRNTL